MQFSLIIPTLNEERFVGLLLKDLVHQEGHSDFEIIHIDASSDDRTCEIVSSFADKLPIRTIISPKRNISLQRNMGAQEAGGKYLIFIDADTRFPDSAFLKVMSAEVSKSKYLIYIPKVEITPLYKSLSAIWPLYVKCMDLSQKSPSPLPSLGLAIFERNFFIHMGGYVVTPKHDRKKLFLEDQEIHMRAQGMGVRGKMVYGTHYIYSLRRTQREGWLPSVPRLIKAFVRQYMGKEVGDDFDYEMGGHLYK